MDEENADKVAALHGRKVRIYDLERRADDAAENADRAVAALEVCAAAGDLGADAHAMRRGLADAARSLREVLSAARSLTAGVEGEIAAIWDASRSGAAGGALASPTAAGLPPDVQDREMGT
jgi:hypothetical protein